MPSFCATETKAHGAEGPYPNSSSPSWKMRGLSSYLPCVIQGTDMAWPHLPGAQWPFWIKKHTAWRWVLSANYKKPNTVSTSTAFVLWRYSSVVSAAQEIVMGKIVQVYEFKTSVGNITSLPTHHPKHLKRVKEKTLWNSHQSTELSFSSLGRGSNGCSHPGCPSILPQSSYVGWGPSGVL